MTDMYLRIHRKHSVYLRHTYTAGAWIPAVKHAYRHKDDMTENKKRRAQFSRCLTRGRFAGGTDPIIPHVIAARDPTYRLAMPRARHSGVVSKCHCSGVRYYRIHRLCLPVPYYLGTVWSSVFVPSTMYRIVLTRYPVPSHPVPCATHPAIVWKKFEMQ